MKRRFQILMAILAACWLGATAKGQTTNTTNGSFANFKIIVDRNIFDPNRSPHRPAGAPAHRAPKVESFGLVGIMSYDKGTYVFFDGTSGDYRKSMKLGDRIADYKLAAVSADQVKLSGPSNQVVTLQVGTQLRREDGGEWQVSTHADSYAANSDTSGSHDSTSSTPSSTSSGGSSENDVIKRLMERRLKESQGK